jgi:ATP-dependent DNA ligase
LYIVLSRSFTTDNIVQFFSFAENEISYYFFSTDCQDIAFDLIFVNGQSVMDLTLQQRVALLKRCMPNTQPKVFELAEQRIAKTTQDVIEALDAAILNRLQHKFTNYRTL